MLLTSDLSPGHEQSAHCLAITISKATTFHTSGIRGCKSGGMPFWEGLSTDTSLIEITHGYIRLVYSCYLVQLYRASFCVCVYRWFAPITAVI